MTTLVSLWDFSLLLCSVALIGVAGLLLARVITEGSSRRREDMRRKLLPAMIRGETADVGNSKLARSVAATLTLELA